MIQQHARTDFQIQILRRLHPKDSPSGGAHAHVLQTACHARRPTAAGLCGNPTDPQPRGARGGDRSMTEHAPGFTILPYLFLFYDIRDTARGLGSGGDTVSDTPESESTLHCLLPDFGHAKIKWGAEAYPVQGFCQD